MFALFYSWIFISGTCIGSFLNVLILRLGSTEHNFLSPRSHCYHCHRTILWRDLVPILSWFYLRGRCRHCQHRFSFRYVLVELGIGILALFCAAYANTALQGAEIFIFCALLVATGLIDLDTWMIPLQLPAIMILTGLGFGYFQSLELFEERLIGLFAGFIFFAVFLVLSTWILRHLKRLESDQNSMGWGDPILIAGIGANLGWFFLPWMVFLASLQGIVIYLIFSSEILSSGHKTWIPPARSMPFGPFLALSAIEISLYNMI